MPPAPSEPWTSSASTQPYTSGARTTTTRAPPAVPEVPIPRRQAASSNSSPTSAAHHDEIIQFASSIYFAGEEDGFATIEIMRIGNALSQCSAEFFTRECSAKAGVKFSPKVETVIFQPGEVLKSVRVVLKDDDYFDTTVEFEVCFRSPKECVLGRYLSSARVLIVDNDSFPSNKFKTEIDQMIRTHEEDDMSHMTVQLLFQFIQFVLLRVPTLAWKTAAYVCLDQLHNVYYLLRIYVKIYLIDVVLNTADETTGDQLLVKNNRYLTAIVLGGVWILPNLVLLVADRIKVGPLDIGRPVRVHLQTNLFRKYLCYTTESQQEVPVQDFKEAMGADIPMLVEDGFMFALSLLRGLGKIVIVALFLVVKDPKTIIPLLVYPTVMLFFIRSRQDAHFQLEKKVMVADAEAEGCIVSATESADIIREYRMRHSVISQFQELLHHSRKANNNLRIFEFWNAQLVPWLTLACVSSYIALGAQFVILGLDSLGNFLAMIEIYNELGDRFCGIYEDLQRGVQAGSPLIDLTKMLNLPTDIPDRMARGRQRLKFMKNKLAENKVSDMQKQAERGTNASPTASGVSVFDLLPFHVDNVHVDFVRAISGMKVEVPPGKIVYVTGCLGSGKTTLLRIITDIVVPNKGMALIALHNRTVDVSNTPHMVGHLNLFENLTFGAKVIEPDRVRRIFCRLQLQHEHGLLELLDKQIKALTGQPTESSEPRETSRATLEDRENSADMASSQPLLASARGESKSEPPPDGPPPREEAGWHKQLSFSERKRIHLARALVFNPEVLVLHKATDAMDTKEIRSCLDIMREFVEERGVEQDASTHSLSMRRPRTLFFSGGENENTRQNIDIADSIWSLDKAHSTLRVSDGHRHLTPNRGKAGTGAKDTPRLGRASPLQSPGRTDATLNLSMSAASSGFDGWTQTTPPRDAWGQGASARMPAVRKGADGVSTPTGASDAWAQTPLAWALPPSGSAFAAGRERASSAEVTISPLPRTPPWGQRDPYLYSASPQGTPDSAGAPMNWASGGHRGHAVHRPHSSRLPPHAELEEYASYPMNAAEDADPQFSGRGRDPRDGDYGDGPQQDGEWNWRTCRGCT